MLSMVAIITARGGSKRIPHKNIKEFCGKPIIAYSIEAALESHMFDRIVVSTDDEEIKEVSMAFGAEVPFLRSKENSDDNATTAEVLREVIEELRREGSSYELACCIYPTAPFITPAKLHEAKIMLDEKGCKSVFAATAFSYPPQRGLVEVGDVVSWWQPQFAQSRSQDLATIYHDAGQFYFFQVAPFLESMSLVGEGSKMLFVPETEVQDIDNLVDWDLAEMKYERMMARDE